MSVSVETAGFSPDELPYQKLSDDELYDFMPRALDEAAGMPDPARHLEGALAPDFRQILGAADSALRAVNPTLTPEYLMPWGYQSPYVQRHKPTLPSEQRTALDSIAIARSEQIRYLHAGKITNTITGQTIAEGVLDVPPYCYQGQEWRDQRAERLCSNACFRMIFAGIAGWRPDEHRIAQSMIQKRGHHIVEDAEYRKVLATDAFQELSGKHVQSMEIMGATLKLIGNIALGFKKRDPGAQVFAELSIGSFVNTPTVWHRCILRAAGPEGVVINDPKVNPPEAGTVIDPSKFQLHWAFAHNRAQIFVAR